MTTDKDTYRAILWPVGQPPRAVSIKRRVAEDGEWHDLEDLDRLLECTTLSFVCLGDGSAIAHDDEFLLNGAAPNRKIGETLFCGNFIHLGIRGNGDSCDLTRRQALRLCDHLRSDPPSDVDVWP